MSRLLSELANPDHVVKFQKWCGVEYVVEPARTETEAEHQPRVVRDGSGQSHPDSIQNSNYRVTRNNNNNDDDDKNGSKNLCQDEQTARNGYVANHHHDNVCENGVSTPSNHFSPRECCFVKNRSSGTAHLPQSCDRDDFPENSRANGSVLSRTYTSSAVPDRVCHDETRAEVGQHPRTAAKEPAMPVSIRYPALYYWAKVGAFLGNEEFYLTVMPYILWTMDSAMVRQTAVVWWLVMYLGQASKDYLAWPRPPSPPVVRLESTYLAEFSMPSTHAMSGTAIPLLLATLLLERYQLPAFPVVCIAVLWCATTCLSRLYLGVHTVLDVICGFLSALGLYFLVYPLIFRYDMYQQTNPLAPVVLVATSLALCTVCYPSSSKDSAKGDAIIITAVVAGVGIGSWLNYQLGYSVLTPRPTRLPVSFPSCGWLGMSVLQFVVGVAVVFAMKVAVKWATVKFFSLYFGLARVDTQHPGVMVGYRYVTYLSLGLAITFLAPLLFTALGFGRSGYYMEML